MEREVIPRARNLDRWKQVKALLEDALDLHPEGRDAFLAEQCAGDAALREEVEAYLRAEERMGEFINKPIISLRPKPRETSGTLIGPYRVVREIGRGGMGTVYLAERADHAFEKRVAIKLLKLGMDTDEIVRRFENERQILASLEHPNVARLLDGGTTEGLPYFVMEHVDGTPVDRYCDAHGLTVKERLKLFRSICSAVHYSHQNLVVHRDLKPTNILVTPAGIPKLLDFGIAKILKPDGTSELTRTAHEGQLMTPDYASPEQAQGRPITTASDVYSLGVLLYKLLTGQAPYELGSFERWKMAQVISQTEAAKPSVAVQSKQKHPAESEATRQYGSDSDPTILHRRLRGDLDNIVTMAMRKDPERRYGSVAELSEDIGCHLTEMPVRAHQDTVFYRTTKFVHRRPWEAATATSVLALILGFTLLLFFQLRQTAFERDRAEQLLDFSVQLAESLDPSKSEPDRPSKEEVLAQITGMVQSGFGKQPVDQAVLLERTGRIYGSLGLYDEARPMLEEALRIRREVLEQDDRRIAVSLHNLAFLMRKLGDDDAAEPLLRGALEIQRRLPEEEHSPATARGLNNLAAILGAKGEYEEAEALYREVLELKRQIHGNEHFDVATGLSNLGTMLLRQDRPAEAESLLQEALALSRRLLGEDHPKVGSILGNLAVIVEGRGDYEEAEAFHREALAIKQKQLGEGHPSVAISLNNLAFCLQATGKPAEAERLYRQALDILHRRVGKKHRHVAVVERNWASLLATRGEAVAAEDLARQALTIMRQARMPPWRIADARSVLGHCLIGQGRYEEAEPLLVDSYPVIRDAKGGGSRYTRDALARVAALYQAWGKPDEAARYQSSAPSAP